MILFSVQLLAQPLAGSFTDCNNRTEDIQATLGSGKALIIAHKGVDCSICRSQAASLESWAAQNSQKVAVWGALTYRYSPAAFNPACTATQSWVTQYNWTSIFTFPDNARQFAVGGTPRYFVYSPGDSTIIYAGSRRDTAFARALRASLFTSLNEISIEDQLEWKLQNNLLSIINNSGSNVELNIYDLNGRLLITSTVGTNTSSIDLSNYSRSVIVLDFRNSTQRFSEKVLLTQ